MYFDELNFSLPDDIILEIKFFKREEFYSLMFNNKEYVIVAEDYVKNLIGVDGYGRVYFLDPCDISSGKKVEIYTAKDLSTFCAELMLFKNCDPLPINASDEMIEASAQQFARKLESLDKDALSDSENFWSLIVEQLEDGLL